MLYIYRRTLLFWHWTQLNEGKGAGDTLTSNKNILASSSLMLIKTLMRGRGNYNSSWNNPNTCLYACWNSRCDRAQPQALKTWTQRLSFQYLPPSLNARFRPDQKAVLHKFMGWDRPILTDSGGFQVFPSKEKYQEEGASLRGKMGKISPLSRNLSYDQQNLGSDIMMLLWVYPLSCHRKYVEKSIERTTADSTVASKAGLNQSGLVWDHSRFHLMT